ncbi:hypothetical protein GCM10009771_16600 [Nesterenkonia flava]
MGCSVKVGPYVSKYLIKVRVIQGPGPGILKRPPHAAGPGSFSCPEKISQVLDQCR